MVQLDVWLYGALARYAPNESLGSHAHLLLEVPEGTRMADLLNRLGIPLAEKGITFINAQLSDMPDLAADLDREFRDRDRVGFFDRQSMWPFQYRFGATVSAELIEVMKSREGGALYHASATKKSE